eukprot:gene7233-1290_t
MWECQNPHTLTPKQRAPFTYLPASATYRPLFPAIVTHLRQNEAAWEKDERRHARSQVQDEVSRELTREWLAQLKEHMWRATYDPEEVPELSQTDTTKITCTRAHYLSLTSSGRVYMWGASPYFEGPQQWANCNRPQEMLLPQDPQYSSGGRIIDIAAGAWHSVLLSEHGIPYTSGWAGSSLKNGWLGRHSTLYQSIYDSACPLNEIQPPEGYYWEYLGIPDEMPPEDGYKTPPPRQAPPDAPVTNMGDAWNVLSSAPGESAADLELKRQVMEEQLDDGADDPPMLAKGEFRRGRINPGREPVHCDEDMSIMLGALQAEDGRDSPEALAEALLDNGTSEEGVQMLREYAHTVNTLAKQTSATQLKAFGLSQEDAGVTSRVLTEVLGHTHGVGTEAADGGVVDIYDDSDAGLLNKQWVGPLTSEQHAKLQLAQLVHLGETLPKSQFMAHLGDKTCTPPDLYDMFEELISHVSAKANKNPDLLFLKPLRAVKVYAGQHVSAFVDQNNHLWTFGCADFGRTGAGTTRSDANTSPELEPCLYLLFHSNHYLPKRVELDVQSQEPFQVHDVALGWGMNALISKHNGLVYVWGRNSAGITSSSASNLAFGSYDGLESPVCLGGGERWDKLQQEVNADLFKRGYRCDPYSFVSVAVTKKTIIGVSSTGVAYTWGYGDSAMKVAVGGRIAESQHFTYDTPEAEMRALLAGWQQRDQGPPDRSTRGEHAPDNTDFIWNNAAAEQAKVEAAKMDQEMEAKAEATLEEHEPTFDKEVNRADMDEPDEDEPDASNDSEIDPYDTSKLMEHVDSMYQDKEASQKWWDVEATVMESQKRPPIHTCLSEPLVRFVDIEGGKDHFFVLSEHGRLYSGGSNTSGERGTRSASKKRNTVASVDSVNKHWHIRSMAAGLHTSAALGVPREERAVRLD